jgi:hypothetical protein
MQDIYNSFSLLNAFDHNKMDNYWYQTGYLTIKDYDGANFSTKEKTLSGWKVAEV